MSSGGIRFFGERLDFTHERIRDVAYDEIGTTRRRVLHLAVADALTRVYRGRIDDVADQIGHHYAIYYNKRW